MAKKGKIKKVEKKIESKSEGTGFAIVWGILGVVCAVVSLGLLPPLFGIGAIVLGYFTRKNGMKNFGLIVMILGAVFMVLGMILGVLVELMSR